MRAELVPAQVEHIEAIAARARPQDVAELWAVARTTPAEAMTRGLAGSADACTALLGGAPVAMFGATPYSILGGIGTPWMVGTTDLRRWSAQKELLRVAAPAVAQMQARFPALLFNVVDQRNTAAQRWLRWLGFVLIDPVPVGPDGLAFIPFYRSAPRV